MVHDPFAALRQEYLENAAHRLAEVERLAQCAATDAGARAELRKVAHNLRGSGGFYGFHQISAASATLEEVLILPAQGDTEPAANVRQAAASLCEAIRHAREKPQGPA